MAGDWFDDGSASGSVSLPELFTATVLDQLLAVVATGALVSLGLSRDGGAVGVTVTFDGRWRRDWFRESEALDSWLLGAVSFLQNGSTPSASSGRRERQRRTRTA